MAKPEGRSGNFVYILLWIVLSSVVIIFNKWILDRFPFSISLTTWHMLFATVATQVLARTTDFVDRSNVEMNVGLYVRAVLPIGMCFSMSLIRSNMVYVYLSLSFIQMLKAIGPVVTLLACWSMGIRDPKPSLGVLLIVCVIVMGVAISALGELRFVLAGFFIQGAAVCFEAYKNTLQQILLGGKTKMSSMTLLYYFAPACTIINAFYILAFEFSALQTRKSSGISPLVFLANGCVTFALNIASVTVIKKTSSVVLTLSGIPKTILLTLVDMAAYHSRMTLMQVVGFGIAGAGTYHYSQISKTSMSMNKVGSKVNGKRDDEESQLTE